MIETERIERMEAIIVTNLNKIFPGPGGGEKVLNQISFSLEEGRFAALVGISGSGKTTLLHLLAGLLKPDNGEILIAGRKIQNMTKQEATVFRRRHIAVIFQEPALLPDLTVEENIVLPVLMDTGRYFDIKKLEEILAALSLIEKKVCYPRELSGGEKQRVVLGRALFSDAELILADEPTARLDTRQSLEIMGMLKKCSNLYHRTVLMATHNQNLAQICDEILELKDGLIHSFGKAL